MSDNQVFDNIVRNNAMLRRLVGEPVASFRDGYWRSPRTGRFVPAPKHEPRE